VTVGALEISKAFTKAMLPGQPVGGGYLTIRNTGGTDDRLRGGLVTQRGCRRTARNGDAGRCDADAQAGGWYCHSSRGDG
jgi:hypothetical protein